MAASVLVGLTGHDGCKIWGGVPVGGCGLVIERLTDRAREVVVNAHTAAQQSGHGSIDAPHLLLGLLRRRDTKGCQALNHAGLRYLDVLIAVQEMYGQAPEESHAQTSFTAEAEALLEGWMREAPGDGQGFVETVHLALACSRRAWTSLEPFLAGSGCPRLRALLGP